MYYYNVNPCFRSVAVLPVPSSEQVTHVSHVSRLHVAVLVTLTCLLLSRSL